MCNDTLIHEKYITSVDAAQYHSVLTWSMTIETKRSPHSYLRSRSSLLDCRYRYKAHRYKNGSIRFPLWQCVFSRSILVVVDGQSFQHVKGSNVELRQLTVHLSAGKHEREVMTFQRRVKISDVRLQANTA